MRFLCLVLVSVGLFGCADVGDSTGLVSDIEQTEENIEVERDDGVVEPVENFREGVLYKDYGLYVSPSNSPVEGERFTGYHTGLDIESMEDIDTSVLAVEDGVVEFRDVVDGYGGVLILSHEIDGEVYSFLYGHLDPDSMILEDRVEKGEEIGVLGEGFSEETDGERKHLHLGVKPGVDLDARGYVASEDELLEWIDPMSFFEDREVSLMDFSERNFDGRELEIVQTLSENESYTRYQINYKSGVLDVSGIMNVPKSEGPHPVLVLNHGYIDPDIYTLGRGLKREQDYFAREGYVVIHPDYRNHAFSSEVGNNGINLRLGYTEDVVNLVKAIEGSDFEFMDKENIGMLGHSMGGGITSNIMVALPDLVDAVVLYAPVSADYRDNFDKWTRGDRIGELILQKYGDFEENPDFWNGVSPINYLDRLEAPVLLQQGSADDSTPIEWADKLNVAAEEIDADLTYNVYEGGPHELIADWPEFMSSNVEFFDQHLR